MALPIAPPTCHSPVQRGQQRGRQQCPGVWLRGALRRLSGIPHHLQSCCHPLMQAPQHVLCRRDIDAGDLKPDGARQAQRKAAPAAAHPLRRAPAG